MWCDDLLSTAMGDGDGCDKTNRHPSSITINKEGKYIYIFHRRQQTSNFEVCRIQDAIKITKNT